MIRRIYLIATITIMMMSIGAAFGLGADDAAAQTPTATPTYEQDCTTLDFTTSTHGYTAPYYGSYVSGSGFCSSSFQGNIAVFFVNGDPPFSPSDYGADFTAYLSGPLNLNSNGYTEAGDNRIANCTAPNGSQGIECGSRSIDSEYDYSISAMGTRSFFGIYGASSSFCVTGLRVCLNNPPTTPTPTPVANVCTVADNSFDSSGSWNLLKSAAIDSSTLVLGVGDSSSQNVSLKSNTTYKIEASVSDLLDGPGSLRLSIGSAYSSIPITARYDYQTTLDTGSVSGPLEFKIFNDSTTGAVIYIDSVCLTEADTSQRTCIAPENGDFQSGSFAGATGWNLYNGATHDTLNLRAILPYKESDLAMASTKSTYAMPTLAADEYLVLGFTASADVVAAKLSSQAGSSSYSYDVYPQDYDYEADISGQAGQTIDLTFANTGATGFPTTGGVLLDNVCVFVSSDRPGLPGPSDPGQLTPIDFGWNYGCKDTAAILAGLGINVFQLEEAYAAGVSLWEFSGWVPWLSAALWVNAGKPVVCFLLETFNWLVGMLEYSLNTGINWADFGRRSWVSTIIWFGDGWRNISKFTQATTANWLAWASISAVNVWLSLSESNPDTVTDWLKSGLSWLIDSAYAIFNQTEAGTIIEGGTETVETTSTLFGMMVSWLKMHIVDLITLPLDFYYSFRAAIDAPSFDSLFTCSGLNFWCTLLAGMQLMNRVSAHTVGYPAVIFGIIVGTIVIFWRWLWELITIRVS